jgi:hypothetical protein
MKVSSVFSLLLNLFVSITCTAKLRRNALNLFPSCVPIWEHSVSSEFLIRLAREKFKQLLTHVVRFMGFHLVQFNTAVGRK